MIEVNMKYAFTLVLVLLTTSPLFSQEKVDRLNSDELFQLARSTAFAGEREKAREICLEILEKNPGYYDASVLIGRTLAWDKNYDSARVVLNGVLQKRFGYRDAIDALADIELWTGNVEEAIRLCNIGLSFSENDKGLLLKKARAQVRQGDNEGARITINQVLSLEPENEEALKILKSIDVVSFLPLNERDYVLSDYNGDFHRTPYKRRFHSAGIGYGKRMSFGPLIGRINLAQTFVNETPIEDKPSIQFELESYPRISASNYLYLNYGYGIGKSFPLHRGGLEWFQKLPAKFEASLGARYLYWNDNFFFYTGSLGKYYRNFWFSFRSFIVPKESGISQSYFFTARRYFKSADDFMGVTIGTGISPDDFYSDPADKIKLKSQKISFMLSKSFLQNFLFRGSFGYDFEEYQPGLKRDRYSLSISLRYYL
jgi:YaiO family outer membrane protein